MENTEKKSGMSITKIVIWIIVIGGLLLAADHFTTHLVSGGEKAAADSTAVAAP